MVDDAWVRDYLLPKHGASLRAKKNVNAISLGLRQKYTNGRPTDELAVRVYVTHKEDINKISAADLIPSEIEGVKTDVIVLGDVKAVATDRQSPVRPVPLGVGIGNWDITQGSLGMLYSYNGEILAGSNAHIVAPSPFLSPSAVTEKRILQPGSYAMGTQEKNVVGAYRWHKQLLVSGSENWSLIQQIGFAIWQLIQIVLQFFNRKETPKSTSLQPVKAGDGSNYIDFGIYKPTTEHVLQVVDAAISDTAPFIGHLFAASESFGIVCKVKYIVAEGFKPLTPTAEVKEGDIVKGSSFWGDFTTTVFDPSARVLSVAYGDYYAPFEDIVLLNNDGTIKGGWSGSGFRLLPTI